MKKILQCGLFALLGCSFIEVNAADIHQSENLRSPSNVVIQSLSRPDGRLSVHDISKNAVLITSVWKNYCNKERSKCAMQLMKSSELQMLNNVFSFLRTLTNKQVQELEGDLISLAASNYIAISAQIENIQKLTTLLRPISLLSKFDCACKSLLTRGNLNETGRAVLREFVSSIKGQPYENLEFFLKPSLQLIYPENPEYKRNDTSLHRLLALAYSLGCAKWDTVMNFSIKREWYGDRIVPLLQNDWMRGIYFSDYIEVFAITYKELPPLKLPYSNSARQSHEKEFAVDPCGVRFFSNGECLDNSYKIRKACSPFNPCEVRISGNRSYTEDAGIREAGKETLAQILFDECVVSSLDIKSVGPDFQLFPHLARGYELEHLSLTDSTITDQFTEFLRPCWGIKNLQLINVHGDKLIDFFDHSGCKIGALNYIIGKEGPSLLLRLLNGKYPFLKKIIFSSHFMCAHRDLIEEIKVAIEKLTTPLLKVGLQLHSIGDPCGALLKWGPILESPNILNRLLIISGEDLKRVSDIDEFGSIVSQYKFNMHNYTFTDRNFDLILRLIPHISISLRTIDANLTPFIPPVGSGKAVFEKILDFCQTPLTIKGNIKSFLSDKSNLHVMLHPYIADRVYSDWRELLMNIASELDQYRTDKSFSWGNNLTYGEKEQFSYPIKIKSTTVDSLPNMLIKASRKIALNRYLFMMGDLINNSRDLRLICASIITELSQLGCDDVFLKPLNDKVAAYYTFLADEQIHQLSKIINAVRDSFLVRSLHYERIMKVYRDFCEWIEYFKTTRETFTHDVIAQTKDIFSSIVIALEARLADNTVQLGESEKENIISVIAGLKSEDVEKYFDSVTTACEEHIKMLQEECCSIKSQATDK